MQVYLIILTVAVFSVFILYQTVKNMLAIRKLLPDEIKYRYSLSVRLKAMFLGVDTWSRDVLDADKPCFKAFNANHRNYLKLMLKSFVVFSIIILLIISPGVYYLLTHE